MEIDGSLHLHLWIVPLKCRKQEQRTRVRRWGSRRGWQGAGGGTRADVIPAGAGSQQNVGELSCWK